MKKLFKTNNASNSLKEILVYFSNCTLKIGLVLLLLTVSNNIFSQFYAGNYLTNHELLSFSDDPRVSEQRRKAFEKLQSIVMSLAEYEGTDAIQIVADGEETTTDTPTAIIINSLVFQLDKGNDTVVVILNSNNVVDTEKLKEVLGVSSCALAMNVEQVCGFPPGSVPPIGHSPNALRTILDADLIQEGAFLLGGGGHPHLGCRIRVDMLLMLEGVEVADISLDIAPSKRLKTTSQDNVLKPFFPYPPDRKSVV